MSELQLVENMKNRPTYNFPDEGIPQDFRKAAVLILLWEQGDSYHTLLTRRADHLRTFAGQMCFPGGGLDPDETFEQAALRETYEEVGIAPDQVRIIGRLDDAWSGGRYLMVPYIGYLKAAPVTKANEEVAKIISVALQPGLEMEEVEKTVNGVTYKEHEIRADGECITGLTADLFLEMLEFIEGTYHPRGATRYHYLQEYENALEQQSGFSQ